jgi:hypothetical protein
LKIIPQVLIPAKHIASPHPSREKYLIDILHERIESHGIILEPFLAGFILVLVPDSLDFPSCSVVSQIITDNYTDIIELESLNRMDTSNLFQTIREDCP